MLKNYVVTLSLWGGDKIVQEEVTAQNPNKARVKAREQANKHSKTPFCMIEVTRVELA